jgi:hypothetical protein
MIKTIDQFERAHDQFSAETRFGIYGSKQTLQKYHLADDCIVCSIE